MKEMELFVASHIRKKNFHSKAFLEGNSCLFQSVYFYSRPNLSFVSWILLLDTTFERMILNKCDFIFSCLPTALSSAVLSAVSKAVCWAYHIVCLLFHHLWIIALISPVLFLYFFLYLYFTGPYGAYFYRRCNIISAMCCPTYISQSKLKCYLE